MKSCKLFPNLIGDETIVYKAKNNSETYYTVSVYVDSLENAGEYISLLGECVYETISTILQEGN